MFIQTMQTSSEIFQACETIFGSDVKISSDFLECLQASGIKTAFRKRAFDTHPDRAKSLGVYSSDLNAEFVNVRQAYERLLGFVKKRNEGSLKAPLHNGFRARQKYADPPPYHAPSPDKQHKPGQKKAHYNDRHNNHHDHFYSGNFPKGNLMLGQFLYYSGLISWQTLIDAVCWQRNQRPLIGQIAVSWGIIAYPDVLQILRIRIYDEKFGECALRIGYISGFEQLALVGKQKKLQRPFGEYFIKRGILSSSDLIGIARKQQLHNMTSGRM